LFNKYPTLNDLANASFNDIVSIIRPIGTFNKKAHNVIEIAKRLSVIGYVPTDRDFLESLPGVGRKTANVFLAEYYNYPYIGVDTHVERVSKRLGLASKKDDVLKVEKKLEKCFKKEEWAKRHLQLVLFGRYYCKAIKPECASCKLKEICKEKRKI
jgi:endonuclease-3